MLTLLAERGQVVLLQKRNGTFFPRAKDAPAGTRYFAAWVGTPAASVAKKSGKDNVPSPGTDPASPIPENPGANVGSVSPAAVDKRQTRRKCPSLVPYVRETTRETPRNASDVQDAIYGQTGFAPALSTIRKHFQILKNQGLVNIYAPGRGGKLIPYPTGPSRYVPYVVWKQNDDGVSQPASLRRTPGTAQRMHAPADITSPCPQAEDNTSPVPAAISLRSETENPQNKDLPRDSVLVSQPSAALASPDLSPERADQEIPILPDGVVQWMRRLGVTSVTVQVNL
jgi:hypothetical protein